MNNGPGDNQRQFCGPAEDGPAADPGEEQGAILLEVAESDEELFGEPAATKINWPGVLAAALLHVWLIVTFAEITIRPQFSAGYPPIDSRMAEKEKPDPTEEVEYEIANPQDKDLPVREVLNAKSVGLARTEKPRIESKPQPLPDVPSPDPRRPMYDIPEGVEIDDRVVVKGTTGDSILQIESALDRVTWEIARNMQERKVLVVWLLDASTSLQKQREVIAGRLKRIYGELGALQDLGQVPRREKPLLSGVVSYGERTNFLTPAPTDHFEEVREAIQNVPEDPSGRENVFTAVYQVMRQWKEYRTHNGRRIMLITVTDETGDDFQTHVPAINICRRYGAMAYVIGPTAVFGRRQGYVPYVAPEDGNTYQIPVDLGPETAMFDLVDLPFWFDGPQYKYLSAGLGPYALTRLVKETGGVYFTTSMTSMEGLSPVGHVEPSLMKPFQPDYRFGTIEEYAGHLAENPLRYAVVKAARFSRQNKAEGTPPLRLRVTPDNFREVAAETQKTVAKSQLMIENILAAFPPNTEELYRKESSLRWRMAFNLAYGRLLANRVRCLEYNSALASLKSDLTPEDVGSRANRWIFKPSRELHYATQLKSQAREAEKLLGRILEEAPGTPWARLAARELQNPLGIRTVFRYIPPPKTRPEPQNAEPGPAKPRLLLARERKNRRPKPKPKKKKVVLPRY